jgi:deoxyribodipyrimidine photolyase-related protein
MSNILLILFPTQLFESEYVKKILEHKESTESNPIKSKHIILFEHPYFFTKFPYHKFKLILHRASMKNYYDLIDKKKYKSEYIEYDSLEKINKYIKTNSINEIRFFNPIEKELINMIMENKIFTSTLKLIYPSPYFLNSLKQETNQELTNELGGLRHDLFYKSQRIKYKIMVKKSNDKYVPDGSKWSFDTENRKPFEKNQKEPEILHFESKKRKDYLTEAVRYIEKNFSKHYGSSNLENFIYPINREEAIKWLEFFISDKLDNFGKYEDALSSQIKFGFHSVLSPLTNIGLITPLDILEKVKNYKKNIASKEGFIRQVFGWREYCYFTYDLYKKELESTSIYKSKNKIPKKVWEHSTQIPPIDNILKNLHNNAYSHHIERLMGIGNFLILIETDPKEIYNWFQTMYIDAYDVFMVPNVYGMLCYGKLNEKSHMMTRPYFASSNYIMKMSDYKSELCVKINSKEYKWDEIMNALYWSHIAKYSDEFKKIYATSSGVSRWEKFDGKKKKELIELANLYKKWIHS